MAFLCTWALQSGGSVMKCEISRDHGGALQSFFWLYLASHAAHTFCSCRTAHNWLGYTKKWTCTGMVHEAPFLDVRHHGFLPSLLGIEKASQDSKKRHQRVSTLLHVAVMNKDAELPS